MIVAAGAELHPLDHRFRREAGFPYWTLGLVLEGSMRTVAGGGERVLLAPSLALVPARSPYAVAFGGIGRRWREIWLIFSPPAWWRDLLAWPSVLPGVLALPAAEGHAAEAAAQIEQAQRLFAGTLPNRARLAANALERGLLLAQLAHPHAAEAALHPAVRAARDLLAAAPAERISVAELARRVRLSPSRLAHAFAAQLGETPMRFLERCRIDRAKQLLIATARPIADIAEDCGFADPFHFSTRFRRLVGLSPRDFRKRPERKF
jgi:AraC family transcriptional regulator of arabinose operon